MPRHLTAILLCMIPSSCLSPAERSARDFVHWDALSDAQNVAVERCGGNIELIQGLNGYSPDDYRCVALTLRPGDRLQLSGGYSPNPEWLSGRDLVEGTVAEFIPGQNDDLAAVIKLDSPISADGVTGDVLVLELRFAEMTWTAKGSVHIELCDFWPEAKRWEDRRQGKWVEAGATYQRLSR